MTDVLKTRYNKVILKQTKTFKEVKVAQSW